ncbi:NupC/NupG family nucleoside CNT transporter [Vagococcus entomophilus]|uniref:NupC/NupG family nucleoside CNT transporter n=1 Tax=Vagococcus entomophilus TaxID=1160095 RepID=A0A430AHI0_9ENTE|nr:nucleoside transporter C-terminal domain-containing protein [Vagococcus entomophilus]RSU07370.1 NupC/NupG family nucleoside CNT transporter [Vagococcus entomophilus]
MYLIVNVLGLIVFIGLACLFSKKKKEIRWKSIGIMLMLNLCMTWFLTSFTIGRTMVQLAAEGFDKMVKVSYQGIWFIFPAQYQNVEALGKLGFFVTVLMPILLIVPLFDILTYIGVLPFVIKWLGKAISKITGQPKFESFFAIEMMFLGNTEALAVSSLQLKLINKQRNLTIAMMSMSCVTASIIGAYIAMMPAQFILTAIPVNIINSIIISSILHPVSVSQEEDTVAQMSGSHAEATEVGSIREREETKQEGMIEKEPFFSFLGDSIVGAGKLILIIAANVIAFVAIAALIDKVLQLVNPWLTLEHLLGIVMFPFAWLMGLNTHTAFEMAQYMGTKLVTNEFVVMSKVTGNIAHFPNHYRAVLTVFITSFANFSTLGMIIGCFKGLVDKEKNEYIAKNVSYMLLSGILVSLLSAAIVGLFVW